MMPFRVPMHYKSLTCVMADPTADDLAAYIVWLEQEHTLAVAALVARVSPTPGKAPAVVESAPPPRPTPPAPATSAEPRKRGKRRSMDQKMHAIAKLLFEVGELRTSDIQTRLQLNSTTIMRAKSSPWFRQDPLSRLWTLTNAGKVAVPTSSTPSSTHTGTAG